jgi:hypothetical protein
MKRLRMEVLPDGKFLGFLSKPSFKIAAKGKRHRNEPMTCSFEQIVRLPHLVRKAGLAPAGRVRFFGLGSSIAEAFLCVDTPQETGCIERANKTLQDRLVKELRLQGIATIAAGNELLPSFLADYRVSWRSARPRPTAAIRCGMSSGLMLSTAS